MVGSQGVNVLSGRSLLPFLTFLRCTRLVLEPIRTPHPLHLSHPLDVPLHLFPPSPPPAPIQMAPILPDPDLCTERSSPFFLFATHILFRPLFSHQLPHPRRHRLREGRDGRRRLLQLRLGHRRPALLDLHGGQHPFDVYFVDVARANEVLQYRSFQVPSVALDVARNSNAVLANTHLIDRMGCSGCGGAGFEFRRYRAQGVRGSPLAPGDAGTLTTFSKRSRIEMGPL